MKLLYDLGSFIGWLLVSLSRGLAFFLGVYAALSLLDTLVGGSYNSNVWWIDLDAMPALLSRLLQLFVSAALLIFSFRLPQKLHWRIVGASACGLFALLALLNTFAVYAVAGRGLVKLGFPVPFSLFIMIAFVLLALAMLFGYRSLYKHKRDASYKRDASSPKNKAKKTRKRRSRLATAVVASLSVLLCGIAFPLGQLFCFGLSDYRTQVDAAVVFGAQVHPSGQLSISLANRVDAGIELYEQGYTPVLIMSGGTGVEGVNEAEAMRDYAIKRGVPASAILIDRQGNSTELSVAHTIRIAQEKGFERIGAVSSFYHMARIKMLFLSEGYEVYTVPASSAGEGAATQAAALREIPGWWYYWFGNILT